MPDGLNLVTDPLFYAAAVPAVLLTGLSKSGFVSGLGALAVPLMALAVPVPQAAAILLPLLMVMDATGLQQLWRERSPALVRQLVPAALLGIVVGWLLFGVLSPQAVAAVVGALTLAFLAQRLLWAPKPGARPPARWVGRLCAVAAGFTSFVAHAGAPPMTVKGCRTPARARGKASIGTSFRAGVGQASREETAAHATVVVEGRGRYGDWRCAAGVIAHSDDVRCAMGVRQSGR